MDGGFIGKYHIFRIETGKCLGFICETVRGANMVDLYSGLPQVPLCPTTSHHGATTSLLLV